MNKWMINNMGCAESTARGAAYWLRMAVATACLLGSGAATAQEVAADAKQALLGKLQNLTTLTASFSQEVTDTDGNLVQQLQGVMMLARPAQLRWQTDAPDETLLVANGETVWYYNAFIEQVTIYDQADAVGQSPLLLLLNAESDDWQSYDVRELEPTELGANLGANTGGSGYLIEANSQAMGGQRGTASNTPERLTILLTADNVMHTLVLEDGRGQTNTITLADQQLNQPLTSTNFQFDVPPNVDVDDQRQARF